MTKSAGSLRSGDGVVYRRAMTGGVVGGIVLFWIVPIFVTVSQGRAKDRAGLAYGFFLGWIGVIILAFLPPRTGDKFVECPFCKEIIRRDALVCAHCHREVRPRREERHPGGAIVPPSP
jgi:hypothetical protein